MRAIHYRADKPFHESSKLKIIMQREHECTLEVLMKERHYQRSGSAYRTDDTLKGATTFSREYFNERKVLFCRRERRHYVLSIRGRNIADVRECTEFRGILKAAGASPSSNTLTVSGCYTTY